jgi:protein-S-isoprenylcysteine O-methyltransferase Ste14
VSADALLLRQALVVLSAVLYWAGVAFNARRLRRRLGRNPNLRPRGLKEILLWLGWILIVIAWAGQPFLISAHRGLSVVGLFSPLMNLPALLCGLLLSAAGQAGTYWCYVSLGNCWRIGVNRKERTALVTHGPYRFVRHPIYAFQVLLLIGVACLIPTLLSLLMLATHLALVLLKSLDEERHMKNVHAAEYGDYLGRTGMFLPKLRGLRRLFAGVR